MQDRVLFLSWCPPDLLRPRAIQVGRAAKAIAARGWKPDLVCAALDLRLEDDLVDADLLGVYGRFFGQIERIPDSNFGPRAEADQIADRPSGFLAPFSANRQSVSWSQGAADAALRRIRRHDISVLISFGQPWASHMAALAVKRHRPGIQWVAHFSDPWTDNPYLRLSDEAFEAARADERAIVEAADALVFVTQQTADLVMAKYPEDWRSKVRTIPHLLDDDVLARVKPVPRNDRRVRLVHAGSLYDGQRAPIGLFDALQRLRVGGVRPEQLEIRFVGDMPASLARHISDMGLAEYVSWTTSLYYLPSLAEMLAADATMVIDAAFETSPFLPSKIIDYLMLDHPIVGLTGNSSATAALLSEIGYPVAEPLDVVSIVRLLQKFLSEERGIMMTDSHRTARESYSLSTGGRHYTSLFQSLLREDRSA